MPYRKRSSTLIAHLICSHISFLSYLSLLRGSRVNWPLIVVAKDRTAFETANLAGPLSAFHQDIIKEPPVCACHDRYNCCGWGEDILIAMSFSIEASACRCIESSLYNREAIALIIFLG